MGTTRLPVGYSTQEALRTERCAAPLRGIVAKLKRGDDYFEVKPAKPREFSILEVICDTRGRVLAEINRSYLVSWCNREWVAHLECGYAITPAGFAAVRTRSLKESA